MRWTSNAGSEQRRPCIDTNHIPLTAHSLSGMPIIFVTGPDNETLGIVHSLDIEQAAALRDSLIAAVAQAEEERDARLAAKR